ncbi:MAG TPA: hypothetical protein ENK28_15355 [Aliiroseovarius sp.]|nr:hypothetical protein [Aliiroseovarius sp.]
MTKTDCAEQMRLANRQQTLRLIVALYFMGVAMSLIPDHASQSLLSEFLPTQIAPALSAILQFSAGYLILTGRHMRAASLFLIGFITLARLHHPVQPTNPDFARDMLLIIALLITGGLFTRVKNGKAKVGRIRLVHRAGPRPETRKTSTQHKAAFAQSPDDMAYLFDEIAEAS